MTKKVFVGIIILMSLIILFGVFTIKRGKEVLPDYKAKVDSMNLVVSKMQDSFLVIKNSYFSKIDSIEVHNKLVTDKIRQYYLLKVDSVKSLPIDGQIRFFVSKIPGDLPICESNGRDTTIKVTKNQFIGINGLIVECEGISERADTLSSQLNACYGMLEESKFVINKQGLILSVLDTFSHQKDSYISDLNKTLLEERKTHKNNLFRNTVVGALVGVAITLIVVK